MTHCLTCKKDITEPLRRAGRRQDTRAGVDSFIFTCPYCGEWFDVDVTAAEDLRLRLHETGLATPSLIDAMWANPEVRAALLDAAEEGEDDGEEEQEQEQQTG